MSLYILKTNQNASYCIAFSLLETSVKKKKLPVTFTAVTISLQNVIKVSDSATLIYWHIFREHQNSFE